MQGMTSLQFWLVQAPDIFLTLYLLIHLSRAKWRRGRGGRKTPVTEPDEIAAVTEPVESQENILWNVVAMGVYIVLHKVCGSKENSGWKETKSVETKVVDKDFK